jgi:transcriptional regulator of heat shock response
VAIRIPSESRKPLKLNYSKLQKNFSTHLGIFQRLQPTVEMIVLCHYGMRYLLQLLEAEPAQIWQSLVPGMLMGTDKISIRIGTENAWEPMQICTLVSSSYCPTATSIGSVSLLGPKRMLYEKVIPLVENTADYLTTAFVD